MGLEKSGPELLLRHVMRHIFTVFLLHCKYSASSYEWVRLNLEHRSGLCSVCCDSLLQRRLVPAYLQDMF